MIKEGAVKENKIIQGVRENMLFIIPFSVFFYLLRLSPMLYDGWAGPYYYISRGGVFGWTRYVFGAMRDWINGRVASNFFCGFFESFLTEIPLDFVGALVLTGIIYCLIEVCKIKNKKSVVLVYISLIVLMPYSMRTYVLQIASLQYLTPILFLFIGFLLFKKYEGNKQRKYMYYLWLLSAVSCAWMENTSVAYGVILTLLCIKITLKERKFDIYVWLSVIISVISGLYMVSSNGMQVSRGELGSENSFLQMNLEFLCKHLNNFFTEVIYKGGLAHFIIALFLGVLFIQWYRNENDKKRKCFGVTVSCLNIVFSLCFLVLAFGTNEIQYNNELSFWLLNWIREKSVWLIAVILMVYLMWILINVICLNSDKQMVILLWLYSVILVAVLFPTNQVGERIVAPFYMILVCLVCISLGKKECSLETEKNIVIFAVVVAAIISGDYYSQLCNRLLNYNNTMNARIEWLKEAQFLEEWDEEQEYVLPKMCVRDLHLGGEVVIGTFHYPQFLYRKGLDDNTKIVFEQKEVYW